MLADGEISEAADGYSRRRPHRHCRRAPRASTLFLDITEPTVGIEFGCGLHVLCISTHCPCGRIEVWNTTPRAQPQGLGNTLIEPRAGPENDNAEVRRKQRLGGLLSFYERAA
jgi:hypothetical protein